MRRTTGFNHHESSASPLIITAQKEKALADCLANPLVERKFTAYTQPRDGTIARLVITLYVLETKDRRVARGKTK